MSLYGRRIFKPWHPFPPLAFKCLFLRPYLKSCQEYLLVHSLNCLFLVIYYWKWPLYSPHLFNFPSYAYFRCHCSLAKKTAHSAKGYNKLTFFNGHRLILFISICSSWKVPIKYAVNGNSYHFKYGPQNAKYSIKDHPPRNSSPSSTSSQSLLTISNPALFAVNFK